MKILRVPIILSLLLWLSPLMVARRAHIPEPKCNEALQLPEAVQTALNKTPDVAVSCRVKPSMIEGDFDGDGRPDYAVLVTQQASQKRGFLIVFGNGRTAIAGAGRLVKYGCRSFSRSKLRSMGVV